MDKAIDCEQVNSDPTEELPLRLGDESIAALQTFYHDFPGYLMA